MFARLLLIAVMMIFLVFLGLNVPVQATNFEHQAALGAAGESPLSDGLDDDEDKDKDEDEEDKDKDEEEDKDEEDKDKDEEDKE